MYVCLNCGTEYQVKQEWCWPCMETGLIVPRARRPRSHLAGQLLSSSARELAARHWDLRCSESYPELRFLSGAMVLLYGPPGGGKSTMLLKLLDGLKGSVALFAAEEGLGPTISERLSRLNIRGQSFHVYSGGDLDGLADELRKIKAAALAVDSVSSIQLLPTELRRLQSATKVHLVLGTLQVTKGGLPAGPNTWSHDADAILCLRDMQWQLEKSRYQEAGLSGGVL